MQEAPALGKAVEQRWYQYWTYRREYVLCGKKGCSKLHGPYWYRYQHSLGKMKKEYVGKIAPWEKTAPSKSDSEGAVTGVSTPAGCVNLVHDEHHRQGVVASPKEKRACRKGLSRRAARARSGRRRRS